MAAVWPRCLALGLRSARGGATGALQAYYAVPEYEDFTAAVDLAQTEVSTNFNILELRQHLRKASNF